jgi:hypothetical protein
VASKTPRRNRLPVKDHLGTDTSQALKSSVKRFAILAVFFLMLSLLAVNTHSPAQAVAPVHAEVGMQQDPASVIAAFDAALNAHDVKGGLDLFVTDGFVSDLAREVYNNYLIESGPGMITAPTCHSGYVAGGYCTYSGKDRIGEGLQQLANENIHVQDTGNYEVSGNNVTWTLAVSIELYRRLSISPLSSIGQATVQSGKIQSLILSLTTESIAKLASGLANSVKGTVSVQTTGFLTGIAIIGLVLPLGAIYYISRVKSLFASVPRLERPWFLLMGGVASLFVALLLLVVRNASLISAPSLDMVQYLFVVLTGAFILAAMVLMKRVWTIPSGE